MISPGLKRLRDALTAMEEREPLTVLELPLTCPNPLNGSQGNRWGAADRRKRHRALTAAGLRPLLRRVDTLRLLAVRLVRVAPRQLDCDSAHAALKSVRDGVADALGMDDRDPRVVWVVDQQRGTSAWVVVEIYALPAACEPRQTTQAAKPRRTPSKHIQTKGAPVVARTSEGTEK